MVGFLGLEADRLNHLKVGPLCHNAEASLEFLLTEESSENIERSPSFDAVNVVAAVVQMLV